MRVVAAAVLAVVVLSALVSATEMAAQTEVAKQAKGDDLDTALGALDGHIAKALASPHHKVSGALDNVDKGVDAALKALNAASDKTTKARVNSKVNAIEKSRKAQSAATVKKLKTLKKQLIAAHKKLKAARAARASDRKRYLSKPGNRKALARSVRLARRALAARWRRYVKHLRRRFHHHLRRQRARWIHWGRRVRAYYARRFKKQRARLASSLRRLRAQRTTTSGRKWLGKLRRVRAYYRRRVRQLKAACNRRFHRHRKRTAAQKAALRRKHAQFRKKFLAHWRRRQRAADRRRNAQLNKVRGRAAALARRRAALFRRRVAAQKRRLALLKKQHSARAKRAKALAALRLKRLREKQKRLARARARRLAALRRVKPTVIWRGWRFHKVKIRGRVSSSTIRAACRARSRKVRRKMIPACDHENYGDGSCVTTMWHGRHLSYNRHHDFPRDIINNVYFYAGRANRGKALQNWRGRHRWTTHDRNGYTMCVERPKQIRKSIAFTYKGFEFFKQVNVYGRMNTRNMRKVCRKAGLHNVCDHPNYADGRCQAVMHQKRHFSHPKHHYQEQDIMQNTFWYSGRANRGKSLQNIGNTHRWSKTGDMWGSMFCVRLKKQGNPKKTIAQWRGWNFHKVRIAGSRVNSRNIRKACRRYGLLPICDHENYGDGRCVATIWHGRHMSYNRHHDFPREIADNVYYYAGRANGGKALQNWRHTHRWTTAGDKWGYTMCVETPKRVKAKRVFTYHDYTLYKVRVMGAMKSSNIRRECQRQGMVPVCDHPAYADGRCAVLKKRRLHWSHPKHHGVDQDPMTWTYWYTGRSNHGKSLQNIGNTHRWSKASDRYGWSWCTKHKIDSGSGKSKPVATVNWRGWRYYKVAIRGKVNSANILKTCRAFKMQTPCDHQNYANGRCTAVMLRPGRHMSYNRHHDFPREVADRTYWYCGHANGGKALQNWRNTHRWSTTGDKHGYTWCVKPIPVRRHRVLKRYGYTIYRFRMRGATRDNSILRLCRRKGLIAPCNHPSYQDGRCMLLQKVNHHLSYPPHFARGNRRMELTASYCGNRNHGKSLIRFEGTHRWSLTGDRDSLVLCASPPRQTNPYRHLFSWAGWRFSKVRVEGHINSANIKRACSKYGLVTPCNHHAYYDGRCQRVWINGRHMSYNRHHSMPRSLIDRTYTYCGRAHHQRALQNWRNTHRWSTASDMYGYTLCMFPRNWNSNTIRHKQRRWRPSGRKFKRYK